MSLVRSREIAEDVVHDLFLHLWEQRHTLDFPRAFAPYLFRAARNRAVDCLRHEHVAAAYRSRVEGSPIRLDESQVESSAQAELEGQDLERAIELAVTALPARCREVFLLNRRQCLSYAQVAEMLGISVKTVEIHMTRAMKTLRVALGPLLACAAACLTLR
jgi:RNA polymerase sigma-70 factor (ECF subfamily)